MAGPGAQYHQRERHQPAHVASACADLMDSGTYDALLTPGPGSDSTPSAALAPILPLSRPTSPKPTATTATFSIPNVPNGNYQLVIWDSYLDQVIAYKGCTVPDAAVRRRRQRARVPVVRAA